MCTREATANEEAAKLLLEPRLMTLTSYPNSMETQDQNHNMQDQKKTHIKKKLERDATE